MLAGALPGRMILLRHPQSWYGKEDVGLTSRSLGRVARDPSWAIAGWQRLRDRGQTFVQPDASRGMIDERRTFRPRRARSCMNDASSGRAARWNDLCVTTSGKSWCTEHLPAKNRATPCYPSPPATPSLWFPLSASAQQAADGVRIPRL